MIMRTKLGTLFISVLAVCLVLGLVYGDPFVLIVSFAFGFLLLLDYALALRDASDPSRVGVISPSDRDVRIQRGETRNLVVATTARRAFDVLPSPNNNSDILRFSLGGIPKGKSQAQLRVVGSHIGVARVDSVDVEFASRFGLFHSRGRIPVEIQVKVYPTFLRAAAEAIELLAASSRRRGGSDAPSPELGLGLEYYGSREYLPGDPFRLIDWKGTARLGSLLVREQQALSNSSLVLACNLETPGPVTHDELATAFLEGMIAAAEGSPSVTAVLLKGDEVLFVSPSDDPMEVLRETLGYLLKRYGTKMDDLQLVLEPHQVAASSSLIESLLTDTPIEPPGGRIRTIASIPAFSSNTGDSNNLILHTALLFDLRSVLDMVSKAANGGRATVVYCEKPWLDATDLEEAYMMKERLGRNLALVARQGVEAVRARPLEVTV